MGTFLIFIRKLLSWYGLWIEKEELKEPLQDGQHLVLSDNSLTRDLYGLRVLCSATNDSCWSSSEMKMKGHVYSKPIPASGEPSGVRRRSKPDVYSLDMSIKEVISEESSLSACFQLNSLESLPGIKNYDGDKFLQEAANKKHVRELTISSCSNHRVSNAITSLHINPTAVSALNLVGSQKKQKVPQKKKKTADTESGSKAVKSKKKAPKCKKKKIQGYFSTHKILLIGEGNFSFSVSLARAFNSATNMVATSLNSEEYLQCYYKGAMDNVSELQRRGCRVLHEVDATTLANHSSIKGQLFDRIIYNFPHCGDFSPTERALRKNRSLVGLFMKNSSKMIEQDGEIHIRHRTSNSFSNWDLKGLASEAGLVLIEEAPVHVHGFKGYETKYGFEGGKFSSDDNFYCYPCLTYKFALPEHPKAKLNAS